MPCSTDSWGRTDVATTRQADLSAIRRIVRPPIGDLRFWAVQAMVVGLAGLHLFVDLETSSHEGAFPGGIPVALLVIPVGYAALRYGLAGSAGTAIWGTLLWLPDLLLPHDEGHAGGDLVDLALVVAVALFFGHWIEAERAAHARVEQVTAERLRVEAGYRHLFEANRSPILVLSAEGVVGDANPAARALLGEDVIGRPAARLLAASGSVDSLSGQVLLLGDGRDYRVRVAGLPAGPTAAASQLILEDVTEERSRERRADRYAALVVATEEDQRRRLARELHDEPLQLFLHLARRLESLGRASGVPPSVASGLAEARLQAIEAANRLRGLARDLRPPALDQLGLVAAIASFLAEVEDASDLDTELAVDGDATRLTPELELGAFRIVQEAVRNAVRHAGARQVKVKVTFRPAELLLEVSDDGCGFVPSEGDLAPHHLGLVGMTERARLLGGSLRVQSAPGAGTTVDASIPCGQPARRIAG